MKALWIIDLIITEIAAAFFVDTMFTAKSELQEIVAGLTAMAITIILFVIVTIIEKISDCDKK